MIKTRTVSMIMAAALASMTGNASAFTLFLKSEGEFFGPGNVIYNTTGTSVNNFKDAQVRDLTFTGPFTGFIPMFNNGAAEPNAIAEVLQGKIIDGFTSNGVAINENIDTALHLPITDPVTGESANIMAVAVASDDTPDGSELVLPDAKGNLTFNPKVLADPGQADQVRQLPSIVFTTGSVRIPPSLKTQQGLPGGVDSAGPLPSGRILIGKVGDYDQDGFFDGLLVLGGTAPADLVVARGNPIAQKRPWTSDIPIHPLQAGTATLNNLVQNYPEAVTETLMQGELLVTLEYFQAIGEGIRAFRGNLHRVLLSGALDKASLRKLKKLRRQVRKAEVDFLMAGYSLENLLTGGGHHHHDDDDDDDQPMQGVERRIKRGFKLLLNSLTSLAEMAPAGNQ